MASMQPQPRIRLKQTKDLLLPSRSANHPQAVSLAKVKIKEVSSWSTNSKPLTGMPTTNNACVMWIHLQASICTEWEHSSMVVKSQQAPVSSVREVSNPYGGVSTFKKLFYSQALSQLPPQKRPKTIHRCILQQTCLQRKSEEDKRRTNIDCHVCGSSYENYQNYYNHLLEEACVQQQRPARSPASSTLSSSRPAGKRTVPSEEVNPQVRDQPSQSMASPASPGDWASGLGLAKRTRLTDQSQTISTLCPHFAEATQTSQAIGLNEFLHDQTLLATLKVQLATLLAGLMGEEKLTALGYPDKDILFVLKRVLEMAKCQVVEANEFCTSVCQKLEAVLANPTQVKYRKQKCQLSAARLNISRLLEICLPDQGVWRHQQWSEKPIEDILHQIIQSGHVSMSV